MKFCKEGVPWNTVVIYELKGGRRILVKAILGVQWVVRVKAGEHYGGPNFFEGDKKMYSASRTRKKPFVFVAAAVFGMWSESGQSCLDSWCEHLACCMDAEQRHGMLFRNDRKRPSRIA
jgi:hypothetical protein